MIIMFEAGEYNTNLIGCMEWMIGRMYECHRLCRQQQQADYQGCDSDVLEHLLLVTIHNLAPTTTTCRFNGECIAGLQ